MLLGTSVIALGLVLDIAAFYLVPFYLGQGYPVPFLVVDLFVNEVLFGEAGQAAAPTFAEAPCLVPAFLLCRTPILEPRSRPLANEFLFLGTGRGCPDKGVI